MSHKIFCSLAYTQNIFSKAILSLTEPTQFIEKLKPHYELVEAGGAGHKILCVVLGLVDIYVTSKSSTYKWDTCAGIYLFDVFDLTHMALE